MLSLSVALAQNMNNSFAPGALPPGCSPAILAALSAAMGNGTANAQTIDQILNGTTGTNGYTYTGTVTLPAEKQAYLQQAMQALGIPTDQYDALAYIMQVEGANVGQTTNIQPPAGSGLPANTAVGLFQMTQANWNYFPNGAASIGNGVEEAEGGINYIMARYGSASAAAAHEQQFKWY